MFPNRTKIPHYGGYNPQNVDNNNLVITWIKEKRLDIPEQLKYPGFEKHRNKFDRTPLYYWIKFRKTDIPEDLLYKDCETNDVEAVIWWTQYRCV